MKGYVYVGRGKQGRLKLAAIRSTIKEAIQEANSYKKRILLVQSLRIHVMDENKIRYQSEFLEKEI